MTDCNKPQRTDSHVTTLADVRAKLAAYTGIADMEARTHWPDCPALLSWDVYGACDCDRPTFREVLTKAGALRSHSSEG